MRSDGWVLCGIAKITHFSPDKGKYLLFEAQPVLVYVSIKNRILTQFRPKKSGLRKSARRAHPPSWRRSPTFS